MNKRLIICSLVWALSYSANGLAAVTVKGMERCVTWINHRASEEIGIGRSQIDSAWLLGYLSGVAVARQIDFLEGVDDRTILRWMNVYCRAHPMDRIGYAADALSVELKKRMR